MRLVTFDLDDTLMRCGFEYQEAKEEFGEFAEETLGVPAENAIDRVESVDKNLLDNLGLGRERFPRSFETTYKMLADDPDPDDVETARAFAESVFRSADEYAERGLMEGSEEILTRLGQEGFDLHLITAGDKEVQQKKIDGLELDRFFVDTHIVPMDTKDDCLEKLMNERDFTPEETTHIGNSITSDIKPALEVDARAIHVPTYDWRQSDRADYYRNHERVRIYEDLPTLSSDSPDVFV